MAYSLLKARWFMMKQTDPQLRFPSSKGGGEGGGGSHVITFHARIIA